MSSFSTSRQSLWSTVSATAKTITTTVSVVDDSLNILSSFVKKHSTNQVLNAEMELKNLVAETKVATLEQAADINDRMNKLVDAGRLEGAVAILKDAEETIAAYRAKQK